MDELEGRLDSFDAEVRRGALEGLVDKLAAGEIVVGEPMREVNGHCHTFFSSHKCPLPTH